MARALLYLPDPGSRTLASRIVAGRSLTVRALIAALRAGASVIGVPVALRDGSVDSTLRRMPALADAIHWLDPASRAEEEPFRNGPCLLVPVSVLLDARALEALLIPPTSPRGAFLAASTASGPPLLLAPPALVAGIWERLAAAEPLGAQLTRHVEEARPERRAGPGLFVPIRDESDLRRGEDALFRMLGTALDGWVDERINRRCSRWITGALVRTPLTPNHVSFASLVVGCGAIWCCWNATPTSAAWTLVLYALATILDHSDGEIARLTFQESRFGAQLDWTIDTIIHAGLVLGIGVTAGSRVGLAAAVLSTVGVTLSAIFARHLPREIEVGATLGGVLRNLGNRDFFYLLLLAFALFRWVAPPLLAPLAVLVALGSQAYWIGCMVRIHASRSAATV